jgi:integrase/recombinase XerD
LTVEVVLAAFDAYLDRTRGLCPEVRRNYARSERAFMEPLFGDGDVDHWRNATVHVATCKTGRGALLPLPADLGRALVGYLRHGRPETPARQVFVVHRQHVGAPINRQIVGDAVDRALRHAGIDAPMGGANLLRHSLASDLLGHGASMKQIADVLGHRSLGTTSIYASVDVAALREAALPWPQVTS